MSQPARFAIAVFSGILIAACGSSSNPAAPTPPTSTAKVTAVSVTSTSTGATTFQLTATAQLSDGTSQNVTTAATWQSSNPALATVTAGGVVTVLGSGELDVRATYQNVTGSVHLLVTRVPVTSVSLSGLPSPAFASFQMTATAHLIDGSTQDVTRSATWETSNPQIATVSSGGTVTIVANGDVDVRATYQGVTGSSHLTVSLPKTFSLTGVVAEIAPNVRPVAGARVQIVGGSHVNTDPGGAFSLGGLTVGRTIVEVTMDGYQTWSNEITIVDRDVQLAVNLYPTPPKNADGATATARCNDGSWSWAQTRTDACAANGGVAYAVCPGPLCTTP